MIAGVVLNSKTLLTLALAVAGSLTTVMSIVVALMDTELPSGGASAAACAPTAAEVGLVRSTFLNTSCSYDNVTISSMLR